MCLDRHKRVFLNEGKDRPRVNLNRQACREHLLEMITKRGVGVVRDSELKLEEMASMLVAWALMTT